MQSRVYQFASDENAGAPETGAAISEQEVIAFAAEIRRAVCESDCARFLQLVDWRRIFERATSIPALPELHEQRESFTAGGLAAVSRTGAVHEGLHQAIKAGASYKPVHVDLNVAGPSVLLRLNLPNGGGLNYHQYTVIRKPDGNLVADDIFVFLTAEHLSHAFRRCWLSLAKVALQEIVGEFSELDDPFLIHIDDVVSMDALVDLGRYAEALELYRRFPESLRKNKSLMANALTAAQGVSEEDYAEIIDDFRKAYAHEAALALVLIEGYSARKRFDRALCCVERLSTLVGGDSLLAAKRAAFLLELGRVAEARQAIDLVIAGEPDEYDGFAIGLDVALAERNFEDVLKYLTILEGRFDIELDDLEESDDFAEFVISPQYQAWLNAHRQ